jgi:hypothetical protein
MTDGAGIEPSGAPTGHAIQIAKARGECNSAPGVERAQADAVADMDDDGFPECRALV